METSEDAGIMGKSEAVVLIFLIKWTYPAMSDFDDRNFFRVPVAARKPEHHVCV